MKHCWMSTGKYELHIVERKFDNASLTVSLICFGRGPATAVIERRQVHRAQERGVALLQEAVGEEGYVRAVQQRLIAPRDLCMMCK